jgi:hypothetical protein
MLRHSRGRVGRDPLVGEGGEITSLLGLQRRDLPLRAAIRSISTAGLSRSVGREVPVGDGDAEPT